MGPVPFRRCWSLRISSKEGTPGSGGRPSRCHEDMRVVEAIHRRPVCLESAPVPCALEALRQATHTGVLWTLRRRRSLDGLGGRGATAAAVGALAVGATGAEVLPLPEGAVAAITGTVPVAFWMEAGELIETDVVARVLPAEDATALAAMVATLEEAKGLLAAGCGADRSGTVSLCTC
jgi:hypothetical protein